VRVTAQSLDAELRKLALENIKTALETCRDWLDPDNIVEPQQRSEAVRLMVALFSKLPADVGQFGDLPEDQREHVRQLFLCPTGELAAVMLAAFLEPSDKLTALLGQAGWVRR
jgi:hypothetical protein